jgi:hypothetical protein
MVSPIEVELLTAEAQRKQGFLGVLYETLQRFYKKSLLCSLYSCGFSEESVVVWRAIFSGFSR